MFMYFRWPFLLHSCLFPAAFSISMFFFQVADGLMSIHLSTSNPNLLTMDEPIAIGAPAGNAVMSSDARDFDRLHDLFYRQAEKGFN